MRASLVAMGAAAALALGAGCSSARDAAPPRASANTSAVAPAENGVLVFTRPLGGGVSQRYELLSADAPGTAATRFTQRLFPERDVAVSPDGRTVAFTRPGRTGHGALRLGAPHDIFLASVDGGQAQRLERTSIDERAPRFSYDSRWIAFNYPTSIESDKVGIIDVTSPSGWDVLSRRGDEYGGRWEPGSHRILYSHGSFLNGDYALYVTDAGTGEVTRLDGTEDDGGGDWTPGGQIAVITSEELKGRDETKVCCWQPTGRIAGSSPRRAGALTSASPSRRTTERSRWGSTSRRAASRSSLPSSARSR